MNNCLQSLLVQKAMDNRNDFLPMKMLTTWWESEMSNKSQE